MLRRRIENSWLNILHQSRMLGGELWIEPTVLALILKLDVLLLLVLSPRFWLVQVVVHILNLSLETLPHRTG